MGKDTKIPWCHSTFQPWIGCQRVSEGCQKCYAETYDKRVRGINGKRPRRWGPSAARERTSAANWKQPLKWNEAAKSTGFQHRVFCASLADVFDDHPSIRQEWRDDLWTLISRTRHLTWLLLTKRPENIARFLDHDLRNWPNVWIGATVENQKAAETRIASLASIQNATVRFLSCEPLLEGLDLRGKLASISWVIVGGESGHGARPFHLDWARSIRQQCADYGTALFCKQLGSNPRDMPPGPRHPFDSLVADGWKLLLHDKKGEDMTEFPADLRIRQIPEAR